MKAKTGTGQKHAHEIRLIEYALKLGFIITPLGWFDHLKAYREHGHCPCDVNRPNCPCSLAQFEVMSVGHCKCSLFYRNYETYLGICYPGMYTPTMSPSMQALYDLQKEGGKQ